MSDDAVSKQSADVIQLLAHASDSFCYPLVAENNVSGYISNGYYVQAKYALKQFFDSSASCTESEMKILIMGLMVRFIKLAYELPGSHRQARNEIVLRASTVFDAKANIERAKEVAGEIVNMLCTMREPLANQLPALVVKTKRVVERYHGDPNFNVSMVGEKLGVSGYYASKSFKKHLGVSLFDYICRVRVESAKRFMLDSRLSLNAIARRVGLNDARALNTVFKKIVGMTPSSYRALIKR